MKKYLSERDMCAKNITPALQLAGWGSHRQNREEVTFTAGRLIVRGRPHIIGRKKRADFILFHKPNIPVALIEAKDNSHPVALPAEQWVW